MATEPIGSERPRRTWPGRLLDFSLVRMLLAVFITALPAGLAVSFVGSLADRRFHEGWPELCGAVVALLAYALYVRWIERRRVLELSRAHAAFELGGGLLGGAALVGLTLGLLAALGAFQFSRFSGFSAAIAVGFAQMAFVGVFEELLSRGIVLRLVERSLGSTVALVLSSLLFGLAHLPGEGVGALSVATAVVAGLFFGAAYLATRRLWACIGLHVGWNFTLGRVFSIPVSGHPATAGVVEGRLDGPAWLSGGAYGAEASVLTLLVLLIATSFLLRHAVARGQLRPWRSDGLPGISPGMAAPAVGPAALPRRAD